MLKPDHRFSSDLQFLEILRPQKCNSSRHAFRDAAVKILFPRVTWLLEAGRSWLICKTENEVSKKKKCSNITEIGVPLFTTALQESKFGLQESVQLQKITDILHHVDLQNPSKPFKPPQFSSHSPTPFFLVNSGNIPFSTSPGGTRKTFCFRLAFSAAFSAALRRAPRYCTDKMLRESSW